MSGVKLLALDLATQTGYCNAVIQGGEFSVESSGSVRMKEAGDVTNAAAFDRLSVALDRTWQPHVVVVESLSPVIARNTNVARLLYGLATVAEVWAWDNDRQFMQPINASTIKRHAADVLGLEKAVRTKEHVLRAARVILGRKPVDDNEADAVVLAHYVFTVGVTQ